MDYNRWIDPQFMTLGTDDQVTPDEIDTIVTKTADAVYLKLLKTDGVLNSPADAGDHATNPFWGWQTHIEATTTAARAARTDTAFIRTQLAAILKAITDNAGTDTASAAALKVLVDPSGGVLPRVVDLQRRLDALTVGPVAGLDGASFTIHTQPAAA